MSHYIVCVLPEGQYLSLFNGTVVLDHWDTLKLSNTDFAHASVQAAIGAGSLLEIQESDLANYQKPAAFLTDAPSDGTTYGRKNGAWQSVASGGGGTSGGLAGTWNLSSSSTLPVGHAPGLMYEIIGSEANRDGQRFVPGDIAMVNLDDSTVVNLTSKTYSSLTSTYMSFDTTKGLGTLSNGNKTVSVAAGMAGRQLSGPPSATQSQVEFIVDTIGATATYFAVMASSDDLSTVFQSNTSKCLLVAAYMASSGQWMALTIINDVTAQRTISALPALNTADVVTLGLDKNTRQIRMSVNGTDAVFDDNTLPGTEALTFACLALGATGQLTVNTGPTFAHGFPGYSGSYATSVSFSGSLRVMGTNWDPSTGYPSYPGILPGDAWYAASSGTIAGVTYYSGQGIWYDGGSWRRMEDGPFTIGGMIWGGDLKPTFNNSSDYSGVLPAPASGDEGKTYRVLANAYFQKNFGELSRFFPANSIVTVVNGNYELVSYNAVDYDVPRLFSMTENQSDMAFQSMTLSPIMGTGVTYSDMSGQFEFTVASLGSGGSTDSVGIYLPYALDGVTAQDPRGPQGYTLEVDVAANQVVKYIGNSRSVVVDLASTPIKQGDVFDFIIPPYASNITITRNGESIANVNSYSDLGFFVYYGPYGFAVEKNSNATTPTKWYVNVGQVPFKYVVTPLSVTYGRGYPVSRKGSTTVQSVNGNLPNSGGDISITASTVGAIPVSEKGVANGVATLDGSGNLEQSFSVGIVDVAYGTVAAQSGKIYYASSYTGTVFINNLPVGGSCHICRFPESAGTSGSVALYVNGYGDVYVNNAIVSAQTTAAVVDTHGQMVKLTKLADGVFSIEEANHTGLIEVRHSVNLAVLTNNGKYFLTAGWEAGTGPFSWNSSIGNAIVETITTRDLGIASPRGYSCQAIQRMYVGDGLSFKRTLYNSFWGPWSFDKGSRKTLLLATDTLNLPYNVGTVLVKTVGDVTINLVDPLFNTYDCFDGAEVTIKKIATFTGTITINPGGGESFFGPYDANVYTPTLRIRTLGESVTLRYSADRGSWMIVERYSPTGTSKWVLSTLDTVIYIIAANYDAHIRTVADTAVSVILPSDTDLLLPIGTEIPVTMAGNGAVTFSAAVGATITNPSKILATKWDVAVAKKVDANTWDLIGPLT